MAITARGDGNRWYGRISIPESAARAAGLLPGLRVTARCADGLVIVHVDEHGRIRFPPARGKTSPRHAFEAATATLGLRDTPLPQTPSPTEVVEGAVRIRVPEEFLASDVKARRKPRKEAVKQQASGEQSADLPVRYGVNGAAAAIMTEASRVGKVVRPLSLESAMQIILDAGHNVDRLGPRMFKLDGVSATLADIAEKASKLAGSTDRNQIVIVLE